MDDNQGRIVPMNSMKYDLKGAVKLPKREDELEWIANNLFEFHKQICMLYGTISGYCTRESCPKMTAGLKYEYLWGRESGEPVGESASEYINHVLDWIQDQLYDEQIFPTGQDDKFPNTFREICKTMAKRMFRIFAHIYHHHLDVVRLMKEEAHMNTSLKHFIYFVTEFNLVESVELKPLEDYIRNFT